MKITSRAFKHNQTIPSKYTCDGQDINPPLKFSQVPREAKSLALVVDDPDAPSKIWVHWTLWNIPPDIKEIKENHSPTEAVEGITDFNRTGWGGPCPPSGSHRYFFKLYALDKLLDLPPQTSKQGLMKQIKQHKLAEAELIGIYSRPL